jgi:hypothetical protein
MKTTAKRAVEMTGLWKTRKTKDRFPSFPTALGNRQSAIPTFPQPRRRYSEKWKSKSGIPTFPRLLFLLLQTQKGDSPERRVPRRSGSSFDWNMLSLGDHPKPAIEDHFKTGQR